ncbi:MAG: DUF4388 domain-containing protein [candidate division Zixibacteria bacterium]|jgi:DNA-binding response OmpR family regulator|nr:DUF4388 domain-containing protein [candidate division Zixibacteria bacterium]
MTSANHRPRLDEILADKQQLSDEQIRIALKHQKTFGGKFGSHLLHHGFVSEGELVAALEKQLECKGVQLSGLDIPQPIIAMLPASVAFTRKIIPCAFDEKTNTLTVACENPRDGALLDELHALVPGRTIRLCVAVELSLNLAISRYYGGDHASESGFIGEHRGASLAGGYTYELARRNPEEGTVLLVTGDTSYASVIKLLLERSTYKVQHAESVEKARKLLAGGDYAIVLVHDTGKGEGADLLQHLGDLQRAPRLRCFDTIADLILENDTALYPNDPLHHDLELFTSLLTIKDRQPTSYSAKTTHYADRLAVRLNLNESQRRSLIEACHLLDRAKLYNMATGPRSLRRLLSLATKILQSVYYKPDALDMLRCMYLDLSAWQQSDLPVQAIGGNILTIVDMFHEQVVPNQRLTLERFEAIRTALEAHVGRLVLPDVLVAFVALIREEVLNSPMFSRLGQIMIFTDDATATEPLELRLRAESFRTISCDLRELFLQLYRRSVPDVLVLYLQAHPREIISQVNDLVRLGIDFKSVPTFLIARGSVMPHLTSLLEEGIEDIIDNDSSLDMVALKIKKAWNQKERLPEQDRDGENGHLQSRGSLNDMNLIDLLQALGPSRKTTRITVTPESPSRERLEICLDHGNIVWAKLGALEGADAIYIGMTWERGSWSVEPILDGNVSQPNNFLSNEAILIEGCRRKDEIARHLF